MLLAALAVLLSAPPDTPKLPPPNATPSVTKHPKVIGWPAGKTPIAPAGFAVTLYADGLDNPRWFHVLPNGDVLVSEARSLPKKEKPEPPPANRITLFRDADKDGKPEVREVFAAGLNQPFGMCLVGETLFVANTDGVVRFPYKTGQTKLEGKGTPILFLPIGGTTTTGRGTSWRTRTAVSSTSPWARRATSERRG